MKSLFKIWMLLMLLLPQSGIARARAGGNGIGNGGYGILVGRELQLFDLYEAGIDQTVVKGSIEETLRDPIYAPAKNVLSTKLSRVASDNVQNVILIKLREMDAKHPNLEMLRIMERASYPFPPWMLRPDLPSTIYLKCFQAHNWELGVVVEGPNDLRSDGLVAIGMRVNKRIVTDQAYKKLKDDHHRAAYFFHECNSVIASAVYRAAGLDENDFRDEISARAAQLTSFSFRQSFDTLTDAEYLDFFWNYFLKSPDAQDLRDDLPQIILGRASGERPWIVTKIGNNKVYHSSGKVFALNVAIPLNFAPTGEMTLERVLPTEAENKCAALGAGWSLSEDEIVYKDLRFQKALPSFLKEQLFLVRSNLDIKVGRLDAHDDRSLRVSEPATKYPYVCVRGNLQAGKKALSLGSDEDGFWKYLGSFWIQPGQADICKEKLGVGWSLISKDDLFMTSVELNTTIGRMQLGLAYMHYILSGQRVSNALFYPLDTDRNSYAFKYGERAEVYEVMCKNLHTH